MFTFLPLLTGSLIILLEIHLENVLSIDLVLDLDLLSPAIRKIVLYKYNNIYIYIYIFERRINGCYTRLLRMIMYVSWRDHITNVELYKELPTITDVITTRRLRIAGHCIRHDDEVAHDLILWQPTSGKSNRGRKAVTYIDNLKRILD